MRHAVTMRNTLLSTRVVYAHALAFAIALPLHAQARANRPEVAPAGVTAIVRRDSSATRSRPVGASIMNSSREDHVRVGLITGALIGATAGAIGSTFMGIGCIPERPCHPTQMRIDFAVWFGSIGGVAGGFVGAAIGAVLPTTKRHP